MSDADNHQPHNFLGLFIVSNDDPFPDIKANSGLRLAESQVERISVVIIVPIQRHIFSFEYFHGFPMILLQTAEK